MFIVVCLSLLATAASAFKLRAKVRDHPCGANTCTDIQLCCEPANAEYGRQCVDSAKECKRDYQGGIVVDPAPAQNGGGGAPHHPHGPFVDPTHMMTWTSVALPRYATMIHWAQPSCFGGSVLINTVVMHHEPDNSILDANLYPEFETEDSPYGVAVLGPFFGANRVNQKLGYLHEIGHGSTEHVFGQYLPDVHLAMEGQRARGGENPQLCIAPTISKAAMEVLADLLAACYLARQPTFDLAHAVAALETNTGQPTSIFDSNWKGHHPPFGQRIKYIKTMWQNLAAGGSHDFANACIPLMQTQLMNLDEEAPGFDSSSFCA